MEKKERGIRVPDRKKAGVIGSTKGLREKNEDERNNGRQLHVQHPYFI